MSIHNDDLRDCKRHIDLPERGPIAFVDTGGSGRAILMLHGFSDTGHSFVALEPYFSSYRLIIPDLPGHGASAPVNGMLVSNFASSIDMLIEFLGLSQIALIGHSMGAMTAIELAARRRDDISALILLSASLTPRFDDEDPLSRGIHALTDPINPSGQFLGDWYSCSRPVDADFLAKMKANAAAMPSAIWRDILRGFEETDLRGAAALVTAPVVCLGGSLDPLFDGSHREALSHAFQSVRSLTLPGYGHNPHWEDPERISALILSFLAENGVA